MARRLFDVGLTVLLLPVIGPVMVAVAVALKREGRVAAVLWRSPRLGRGGRQFELLSFSTMVGVGPDTPRSEREARQTRVGRFVRNSSLDHLPMLLNVLRGDLSVVGPRPMEPGRVDLSDPGWQRILSVRPGCASYAILRLARTYNRSPEAEQRRLELEYVERASLRFDLQLLWEALQAKIASRGNIKARGEPTV
jgi:lipopolysaccharide/colanic/teichoic acid biosynthesis glycosyltransferase